MTTPSKNQRQASEEAVLGVRSLNLTGKREVLKPYYREDCKETIEAVALLLASREAAAAHLGKIEGARMCVEAVEKAKYGTDAQTRLAFNRILKAAQQVLNSLKGEK